MTTPQNWHTEVQLRDGHHLRLRAPQDLRLSSVRGVVPAVFDPAKAPNH